MIHRVVSAPARPGRRSLVTTMAALSVLATSAGYAQQPATPAPKPPAAATPKPAPKPAAQPQRPAQTPAQQPAPAAPAQAQAPGETPQFIYSPWLKVCRKAEDAGGKQICSTGKDARTEAGMPVFAAALIEPEGEPRKLLQLVLPAPLHLQYGSRIVIDKDQPIPVPIFTCFGNQCLVNYEANAELIGKLKKGQTLTIQAVNVQGNGINLPLPLAEFAKANEGAPIDPKVFEEQQKKLQEELQKRAEEARKKLEGQQGAQPAR